jgi:hypothetical protein
MGTTRIFQNSDNFVRGDLSTLGANWDQTLNALNGSRTGIKSNGTFGGAGGMSEGACARWVGTGTFTNDQYAQAEIVAVGGSIVGLGVIVRAASTTDLNRKFYAYQTTSGDLYGAVTTRLVKVIGNGTTVTTTVLASSIIAWATNDMLEIEVIGTTIRGMKNGIVQVSVTDTDLSTGTPGLWTYQNDITSVGAFDYWQGGKLIATSDLPMTPGPAGVGTISGTLLGSTSLSVTMAGTGNLAQTSNIQITSSHMVGTGALSGPLQYFTNSTCHMYGGWSMGTVKLAWNPNTEIDLAGYKIYIGTSSGIYNYATSPYVSPVNVGMVQTFTFILLPGGVTYYFAITAFNSTGQESAFSSELAVPIETYHAYSMTLTGTNVISGSSAGTAQLVGNLVNTGQLILIATATGMGTLSAFGLANKAGAMSAFPNLGAMASSSMTLTGTGALIRNSQGQSAGALTGTLTGTQGLIIPGSAAGTGDMQGTLTATGYMSIVITGRGVMSIHSFTQVGTAAKQYRTKLQAGEVHSSPKR